MAETDWTELTGGLAIGTVDRGVTAGGPFPNSSGSNDFVFGFNSLSAAEGVVGFHTNQTDFSPLRDNSVQPTGGSVRGAIQRGQSAATTDFASFFFIGLTGTSVDDDAYILGLSDDDPSRIVLRKGKLSEGIPDFTVSTNGILRQSEATVATAEYVHLRLDMVHNDTGDVILQVFQNDLSANPINDPPSWTAITGMTDFTDDALGVNSTEAGVRSDIIQPFVGGYAGFGFYSKNIQRRGWFDHIEIYRQL